LTLTHLGRKNKKVDWISKALEYQNKREALALVTISDIKGSCPRGVGTKMLANLGGRIWGTIGGGNLETLILDDCQKVLTTGVPQKFNYPLSEKVGQCCGGWVEVLIEIINNNPHLFIFGAGHIGTQLCQIMCGSVFETHLIDSRAEWVFSNQLPDSIQKHHTEPFDFLKTQSWQKEKDFAVIMTHDHALDQILLKELCPLELNYLGLIGSTTKWKRFQDRLTKEGVPERQLQQVHCPIGFNIGAETPQEIAISIGAELIRHFYLSNS
jgi:xanthine dehydrogenase accessory factor